MAKITIVDENDKVIGAEERKVAVENGLIHRIARVVLKNSNNQIYLQKRGPEVPTWPGRWDQSAGGHVDEGEDYYDAAVRELREELGICNVNMTRVDKWYKEEKVGGKKMRRFNALFAGRYDGDVILAKDEVEKGGWFDSKKIKKWMREKPNDFCPSAIIAINKFMEKYE